MHSHTTTTPRALLRLVDAPFQSAVPSVVRPTTPQSSSSEQTAEVEEHVAESVDADVIFEDDRTSCANSNSTYAYGHEPYSTFKDKLRQLVCEILPESDQYSFDVEHIKGGTYNRIIGLTITPRKPRNDILIWIRACMQILSAGVIPPQPSSKFPPRCIIRIPRHTKRGEAEMEYDVAILQFAGKYLDLPIPRVVSSAAGVHNAINMPYMIQERLPGQTLATVMLGDFTSAQRKCLVRQMVDVHRKLQTITSSTPGVLSPSTFPMEHSSPELKLDMFPVTDPLHPPTHEPASPQTTVDFLVMQAERWRDWEEEHYSPANEVWTKFAKIARHMHTRGFLPDTDKFYLCHLDLYSRNILVDTPNDTSLKLTALLDWDSEYVCFCPKFVAYSALFWLWVEDEAVHESQALEPVTKPELENAKRIFDTMAGEEWLRYAYRPEYVLARRMFELLRIGLFDSDHYAGAHDIVDQWKAMYPEDDVKGPWDLSSDDGESDSGTSLHDSGYRSQAGDREHEYETNRVNPGEGDEGNQDAGDGEIQGEGVGEIQA